MKLVQKSNLLDKNNVSTQYICYPFIAICIQNIAVDKDRFGKRPGANTDMVTIAAYHHRQSDLIRAYFYKEQA